jgi:hypothetical protein
MMWAPFIANNDDMLSQLAQFQIFVTLLSSLALRAIPTSVLAGSIVSALLLIVPSIGILLETPLLEYVGALGHFGMQVIEQMTIFQPLRVRLGMGPEQPQVAPTPTRSQMGDEEAKWSRAAGGEAEGNVVHDFVEVMP